ncbi:uncharacterized protein Z518_02846 [Rhinocladiella mackenziei CBS 650.93]|uniref:Uncharacterized protein n=1 Tax=Rhinocladiella mackenziei CBS 650.93 TaxID=1442369 RepID=A0A0D2JFU8_9EURO|nr:uncharacterized protein Z518_02846 [Rhinocladiella mackenziei CBS 650.93]KIX08190.1 hypothetical protein Z518_02846 [Rhinocladiella mackenziei CBS 650.93]
MQAPDDDKEPGSDQKDPATFRFITANPRPEKDKQESRALIRAYGSHFSWAKVRKTGYKLQDQEKTAHVGSNTHARQRLRPPNKLPCRRQQSNGKFDEEENQNEGGLGLQHFNTASFHFMSARHLNPLVSPLN